MMEGVPPVLKGMRKKKLNCVSADAVRGVKIGSTKHKRSQTWPSGHLAPKRTGWEMHCKACWPMQLGSTSFPAADTMKLHIIGRWCSQTYYSGTKVRLLRLLSAR